ncbi:MAG: DEAD/DEAH box helicase, partial [Planctomycetota bacterium]
MMDVEAFLGQIRASDGYRGQIVGVHTLDSRPPRFAQPRSPIQSAVRAALEAMGIRRFYTHQAAAIDSVTAACDTVVVTGTASGKTLCYNVPILNGLLHDPNARALYVFPTKALAQDQLGTLQGLLAADPRLADLKASTYDGDTPQSRRKAARREAAIILTNPDMLHNAILP